MEWIERCNSAIGYIEDRLEDDIDYEELGRIAACSAGSFQRTFSLLAGITIAEYVRRRRMTLAAFELQSSDSRVIDVAVKYGYETADAFGVAFKRMHGVSPAAARKRNTKIKSYPRLSFSLTVRGDAEMNYRVVERDEFTAIGKIVTSSLEDDRIPQFWDECKRDGAVERLREIGVKPHTLGICFGYDSKGVNNYMVGAETGRKHMEGMITVVIPKSTWLVFESVGPVSPALGNLWKRIYGEFLPQSIYRQAEKPTLEVYCRNDTWADDYTCEVWIPVEKSGPTG